MIIISPKSEYKEFREDGWPICPNCGQDELQNPHVHSSVLDDYIAAGLWCLSCGWYSITAKWTYGPWKMKEKP